MAESVVSLTYGAALFEAAKELGKEDEFLRELETLDEILADTPEFAEFLDSPAIMGADKKRILTNSLEGRFSREMVNFCSFWSTKTAPRKFGKSETVHSPLR